MAGDKKETEALRSTYEHIELVKKLLASAQIELMRRQFTHDQSKLHPPEWEMFSEVTHRLAGMTYGSDEYKECLAEMRRGPLGHHYEHNRHHPEFFEARQSNPTIQQHLDTLAYTEKHLLKGAMHPDEYQLWGQVEGFLNTSQRQHESSVNEMNLFDILEMFIDWCAAVQRHDDGDIYKSIRHNEDRFSLCPQLVEIFKNTAPWVKDEFAGLKTQKELSAIGDQSENDD